METALSNEHLQKARAFQVPESMSGDQKERDEAFDLGLNL
jgi:hypothetical protein